MIIKEMRPEYSGDWFDFFDHRAFADHEDWNQCYCTFFFMPRLPGFESRSKRRRDYATWLVESGAMKGYVAYEYGKIVGWCNVNRREAYPALADLGQETEPTLAITCFIIEKAYRGKGIAQKFLDRIIKDAKARRIAVLEAYPKKKATSEFGNYHGPYSMYEKNGFALERIGEVDVMRRRLG